MITTPFREPARLLYHLNGTSRIVRERFEGIGMAAGGNQWDISTDLIPIELRGVGSRFLLVGQHVWPESADTADELRAAVGTLGVETIECER